MTDHKSDPAREQRERDLATADSVYSEWNFGSYAKLRHLVADALAAARAERDAEVAAARREAFAEAARVCERAETAQLARVNRAAGGTFANRSAIASADALSAVGCKLECLAAAPSPAAPAQPEPANDADAWAAAWSKIVALREAAWTALELSNAADNTAGIDDQLHETVARVSAMAHDLEASIMLPRQCAERRAAATAQPEPTSDAPPGPPRTTVGEELAHLNGFREGMRAAMAMDLPTSPVQYGADAPSDAPAPSCSHPALNLTCGSCLVRARRTVADMEQAQGAAPTTERAAGRAEERADTIAFIERETEAQMPLLTESEIKMYRSFVAAFKVGKHVGAAARAAKTGETAPPLTSVEGCTICGWRGPDSALDPNDNDICPDCKLRGTMTTYYGADERQEFELTGDERRAFVSAQRERAQKGGG